MRLGIGVVLACVLATTPVAAQITATELLSYCETFLSSYKATGPTTPRDPHASQCFGYFSFVWHVAYLNPLNLNPLKQFSGQVCFPDGAHIALLIRVYVNYGRQHPEQLNQTPFRVVMRALTQAFPCKHSA